MEFLLIAGSTTKGPSVCQKALELGYKDSNLENDGVRVRCLTIWR